MATELSYTDSHMALDLRVESCRSMTSTGLWERLLGCAEFFVHIHCQEAEGPDEFFTKTYKRSKKIVIEETFTFVLPERFTKIGDESLEKLTIHVTLYKNGQKFGTTNADISEVELLQKQNLSIDFTLNQEILMLDLEFEKRHVQRPDFRYSLNCSEAEEQAASKRKQRVFESMKSFLPQMKLHGVEEVPSIAMVCSGGGYRATVQFCGAMEAIREAGLLDCTTYLGGLSGGCWYILPAYVKKALDDTDALLDYHSEIKQAAKTSLIINSLTDISHYMRYRKYAKSREAEGQPTTFVDYYGFSVGKTFLGNQLVNTKLSDISEYAANGDVPIPIITSLHTKSKIPSAAFSSDLEVTPWEASLPHYGINIPIEKFGSEWYKGSMVRLCQEYPLHYFLGASSIAFGILLKYYLKGETSEADQNFLDDVRQHQFGRHKTKRMTRSTRRKTANSTTTERKKLFAKYAEHEKPEDDTDSIFARQKSRSCTKRKRRESERLQMNLPPIRDEANETESRYRGQFLSVPDEVTGITSDGEIPTVDGNHLTDIPNGDGIAHVNGGTETIDNHDVEADAIMQTFKRRTCRFSSANLDYETVEEEDEDSDIFYPASDRMNSSSPNEEGHHPTTDKRNESKTKGSEKQNSSYLLSLLKRISKHPLFTDREAVIDRTAKALNMARGFTGVRYHHLNPNYEVTQEEQEKQNISTTDDVITFVDPAIIGNVPCNALIRRKVDVIIVCDATEYKSDTDIDYLELFLSESSARKQGLKFPKIDPQKLKDDPRGIVHVFEDKDDPGCPIVIWFTLCNKEFKALQNVPLPARRKIDDSYKLPPNETFNIFPVYGPKSPYQTLNTSYTPLQFDRLRALMKHSISSNMPTIKSQIVKKIHQRQSSHRSTT